MSDLQRWQTRALLGAAALLAVVLAVTIIVESATRETSSGATQPEAVGLESGIAGESAEESPGPAAERVPAVKSSLGAVIDVRQSWNVVEGYGWPPDQRVTITVDDDADPANGVLFSLAEGVTADSEGGWVHAFERDDVTLDAGQVVTAESDSALVVLTVALLSVSEVDVDSDIIAGTSEPRAEIKVAVHGGLSNALLQDGGPVRRTTADRTGRWSVDFSVAGMEADEPVWDIVSGQEGCVAQIMPDWNVSRVRWQAP